LIKIKIHNICLSGRQELDHPFVYSIVEKQTGTVLFLGMVNDPASN